jgi:DNA processing protein
MPMAAPLPFGARGLMRFTLRRIRSLRTRFSPRAAILSEFPLGTFPAPQNFPIRNRIISGISIGVLVIEAGEFSGTRVTARCALEQGREVFAVPGNVTNKLSWGPNTLIKQGAALIATWEDVWEALPADTRLALTPSEAPESQEGATASLFETADLPPAEKKVFALLRSDESTHIDQLVERLSSYLSSSEIFSALFELELSGRIRQLPGKYGMTSQIRRAAASIPTNLAEGCGRWGDG